MYKKRISTVYEAVWPVVKSFAKMSMQMTSKFQCAKRVQIQDPLWHFCIQVPI